MFYIPTIYIYLSHLYTYIYIQIERLRFVSSLKVLNLEGNPIAKQPDFPLSEYITAMLPQLNYYEYVFIKNEIREAAQKRF